eukprot:scpid110516/ scgid28213/ 
MLISSFSASIHVFIPIFAHTLLSTHNQSEQFPACILSQCRIEPLTWYVYHNIIRCIKSQNTLSQVCVQCWSMNASEQSPEANLADVLTECEEIIACNLQVMMSSYAHITWDTAKHSNMILY